MSTHVVICNKGFISEPMSAFGAYRFGRQLEQLGNYDIWVMEVSREADYRRNATEPE